MQMLEVQWGCKQLISLEYTTKCKCVTPLIQVICGTAPVGLFKGRSPATLSLKAQMRGGNCRYTESPNFVKPLPEVNLTGYTVRL